MLFAIIKAFISIGELVGYWVPCIRWSIVLPEVNELGESSVVRKNATHSILSALSSEGFDSLAVLGMAIAVLTLVFSLACLVLKGSKFKKLSTGLFIASLAAFVVLFVTAYLSRPNF